MAAKMADEMEVFHEKNQSSQAFSLMEDIRRRGKLCDVTLKVPRSDCSLLSSFYLYVPYKGATISLSGGGAGRVVFSRLFFHLMFKVGFFFSHTS